MDLAFSVNDVPVRLTDERWAHIVENRDEVAGHREDCLNVVEDPDLVTAGYAGALVAVRGYGRDRYLAVVYREIDDNDGFIVTAYFTSKVNRGRQTWP